MWRNNNYPVKQPLDSDHMRQGSILIVLKFYWYDINFESWRDWIEMVFNNYRKISIAFYNDCLFLCCDNRESMIVFEDL